MADNKPNRFANLMGGNKTAFAKAAETAAPEAARKTERRTGLERKPAAEQDTAEKQEMSAEQAKLFQILRDTKLRPEERADKMAELLAFNFVDPESEAAEEMLQELRVVVKRIMSELTAHNRRALELSAKSPLSELKRSVADTLGKYVSVEDGRADLKDKMDRINKYIDEAGGEEELINALVEAKKADGVRKESADIKDAAGRKATEALTALQTLRTEKTQKEARKKTITDKYKIFRSKEEAQLLLEIEAREPQLATDVANAEQSESAAKAEYLAAKAKFDELMADERLTIHEEILKILDIASPEFVERLKKLGEDTIAYIDFTEENLTGVWKQLTKLLDETKDACNVSANTNEQLSILTAAINKARDVNTKSFEEFKKKGAEATSAPKIDGLQGMETMDSFVREKVTAKANQYVTGLERAVGSVAMISATTKNVDTALVSLQEQLADGVQEADQQLILATSGATASGMILMQRAQTVGVLSQSVMAKGIYQKDMKATFEGIQETFTRNILAKTGRAETFANVSAGLREVSAALEDKNEVTKKIAVATAERIDEMMSAMNQVASASKDAAGIEASINERLMGASPEDRAAAADEVGDRSKMNQRAPGNNGPR